MYIKIDACPVCGSRKIRNLMICKDHLQSGESFAINECTQCSLQFTNPRPEDNELGKYYDSDHYISHSNKSTHLINRLYKLVRQFTLQQKLKLINEHAKKGRMLDVGCGTGEFLKVAKDDGWKISGIEPAETARKQAENLTDIPLIEDLYACQEKSSFKLITLWHVMEHLPDLHRVVDHVKYLLTSKGRLMIALPNHESYDAIRYKQYWAAYDVPRHLYHFDQKSFSFLAKKHQLSIKKIIPMRWDAFYVTLLSEKYKTGSSNPVKSFFLGLRSNQYARKNNQNYSSLIYVLKK